MKNRLYLTAIIIFIFSAMVVSADEGGYIVKLKNESIPTELGELLTEVDSEINLYKADTLDGLEKFSDFIEYTEENQKLELIDFDSGVNLLSLPDDELYIEQWQTQMINADFAWELETYGNEVNVAVIDTGCSPHKEINLVGGYNVVKNSDDYSDYHGHGTHVAGIISAQHNGMGIAGVAPKVNIYAIRCMDPQQSSSEVELIEAIKVAVDEFDCKVINMSLGVPGHSAALYEEVKKATDKGVIIVSAAGNEGNTSNSARKWYPASYDEVIGVGSVGIDKSRSYYSQKNSSVFVVAPGELVRSTSGTASYVRMSGTSQATPMVTGAVALMFSANPNLTLNELKYYIRKSSEPLVDDYCGYGLLNVKGLFEEYLKSVYYYVSPINDGEVLIYNNTDSLLPAKAIFAEYNNGRYVSSQIKEFVLMPDKKIKMNHSAEEMKFFLWHGIEPLAISR